MKLSSPSFRDGEPIPAEHATERAGGRNISPPLRWTAPPEGTRSLVLEMIDRHPAANDWVHWLVVDLPADARELSSGASPRRLPAGARELTNTFGQPGYDGPQPPKPTGEHPYEVALLALDLDALEVQDGIDYRGLEQAVKGHVLERARLLGRFRQ